MAPTTYLILAGNLGTGKTTAAASLIKAVPHAQLLLEEREAILERFYADPNGLAFAIQLAYSLQYLEHAIKIAKTPGVVIQDRSMFDTHEVFSVLRHDAGAIDPDQFEALNRIFRIAVGLARPTHLVLLDAAPHVSLARVATRGVAAEAGVTLDLIRSLRSAYLDWYARFDLCPKVLIDTGLLSPEQVLARVRSFAGLSEL